MALAAVFFLAMPAEAAEGRGGPPGLFDRLIAWVTDGWDRLMPVAVTTKGATSGDQEGGYLDPNGGGHTGSCEDPAACEDPLPASSGNGS